MVYQNYLRNNTEIAFIYLNGILYEIAERKSIWISN